MNRRTVLKWLVGAIACVAFALPAWAALSPAQLATLKTNVQANSDTNTLYVDGNLQGLADLYNAPAAPEFIVWKSALSRHDILTATGPTGTTFAWAAGAYITRSQGERDAFREMFNSTGNVNPALPTMQAAFADIFSGAGGAGNRAHILAMSKRIATRLEKLFATGTGSDANPATMAVEGEVHYSVFIGL